MQHVLFCNLVVRSVTRVVHDQQSIRTVVLINKVEDGPFKLARRFAGIIDLKNLGGVMEPSTEQFVKFSDLFSYEITLNTSSISCWKTGLFLTPQFIQLFAPLDDQYRNTLVALRNLHLFAHDIVPLLHHL